MEETLIINYYNDLPSYAIVIDNLNEEYDNLNNKYEELLKYKPIIQELNNKSVYTIDRKVIILLLFVAFIEITIMLILI